MHLASITPRSTRFGSGVSALSALLLASSLVACVTALATPELVHGPAVMIGSMRGTAAVMLVLVIPLLALAMLARGDGALAAAGWIAGLVFLTYQAWMFLFAVPFNGLFLVYVVMLATGFWGLVALLVRLDADPLVGSARRDMPVRALAGWMVGCSLAFYALWLKNVVPALFDSESPAFLAGTGMVTATNYVLDLAFFLPFTIGAAVVLWRRVPRGIVVGGSMLIVLVLESISIAVDQWAGSAADPTSTVASAALTPIFLVVALIGAVMTGLWYRGIRGVSTERDATSPTSAPSPAPRRSAT